MRLSELIEDKAVLKIRSQDKWAFFREISAPLAEILGVPAGDIVRVLEEREKLGTTAIGHEIALPHSRMKEIERFVVGVGVRPEGLDFEALDGKPVKLVFVILAPENKSGLYLKVLAHLAKVLKDEDLRARLIACSGPKEFKKILAEVDHEL